MTSPQDAPGGPSSPPPNDRFEADLRAAAGSDVTVLLEGEHGSGKSRAARRLHELGSRSAGPRVEVELGALSETLLEAELFGHEEGAFTGATKAREGRFRRAQGGTIVLEGVEDLPAALQGKLLRVLQEKEVEPLGAEGPVPIDVRVVATSSASLEERVEEGLFREDLFYRLAVVRLTVPALRQRRDELDSLAAELATRVAERSSVTRREFDPGALERLRDHPWPGNVLELENALERVMVLPAGEGPVTAEEFEFLTEATRGVAGRLAAEARAHGVGLDELTRAVLEGALEEARGNTSAAARAVGLSRRAFDYRWNKLREESE